MFDTGLYYAWEYFKMLQFETFFKNEITLKNEVKLKFYKQWLSA